MSFCHSDVQPFLSVRFVSYPRNVYVHVHVHQLCFYDVTYEIHMVEIGSRLILFYFIAIFYLYICFIIFDKYFLGEYSDMCVLRQR